MPHAQVPSPAERVLLRSWRAAQGASPEDIARLSEALPFTPPSDYIELLTRTNGGEGELAAAPGWFQLFEVEFALSLWSDAFYRTEYPSYYFFGSNGGLESLALVIDGPTKGSVVAVDTIAGDESAILVASEFTEFLDLVGVEE
ncbi:SMI1/KNR4 family protein [Aquabacterium humicola]|uniref:SMI1/KNR4 family protein n=1 Tax=Aquabacterium humicola TaxID=3237377 RepID=UPI0025432C8D|nr:SMI1/KNR4 family protein [Rubrivivax pictus]